MDHRFAKSRRSATPSTQAVALCAFLLVMILAAWRAADLFTNPADDWVPASTLEASLMGVLEPVTGRENIRLSVTEEGSARSVLILLSARVRDTAPTLERLARSALMLDPAEGDQLIIEQAAFARQARALPSASGWIELGLYGLLGVLLARIGLTATSCRPAPARQPLPVTAHEDMDLPPRTVQSRSEAPAAPAAAARLVRKDPARTASILRSWMRGEGDAA